MSIFSVRPQSPSLWIMQLVGEIRRAALEFVYPPSCLLCHQELVQKTDDASEPSSFCLDCVSKLVPGTGNACRRCGAPVGPYVSASDHCILCRKENFAFDEVVRLGLYRDELRTACLFAKNPSGLLLCHALADLLVSARPSALGPNSFDLVIPVPEHWVKRLIRRQYAAETMARRISDRLNVRLATGILAKARWTPKQAKSAPVQRRQQQQNAFRAAASVKGQSILLVDDILTTGATADAAARELKRAGARRVVVAVMAVSPPRA